MTGPILHHRRAFRAIPPREEDTISAALVFTTPAPVALPCARGEIFAAAALDR